jgi:hypothetical protein
VGSTEASKASQFAKVFTDPEKEEPWLSNWGSFEVQMIWE